MTRIDAHQHFWDRSLTQFDHSWQEADSLSKICRSFLPEDLQPLIAAAGVDQTIFVQTQHNTEENHWALKLAEQNEFVAGVVGWVDLTSPECESQLLQFKDRPGFIGVRHVVQDEPDDDFIVREDVCRGLGILEKHDVPFDLLFYAKHLKHAATVAGMFPDLPLVINHLSKPAINAGISSDEFAKWKRELKAASEFENVFAKLSGMVTEADWSRWTIDDLRPYADWAIECFGSGRLMFGSDWPVCELAANYEQVCDAATSMIAELSEREQSLILGGTARRFYQL